MADANAQLEYGDCQCGERLIRTNDWDRKECIACHQLLIEFVEE